MVYTLTFSRIKLFATSAINPILSRCYKVMEEPVMLLAELATDDFQKRHAHGGYPASGKPDAIRVHGNCATFEFKNTSETEAKKWVANYLKSKGIDKFSVDATQDGDYQDDWVTVSAIVG